MLNLRINTSISASIRLATFLASLSALTVAHAAAVYIWRDADGNRQYSDYCPNGEKCRVKYIGSSGDTGDTGGKKGKSWKSATTTSTDTTSTSDDTTSDTTTTNDTTTDDSASEPVADETATLDWDAVDHSDLGGYRVYYATAGGYYQANGQGIDVGNTTNHTVTALNADTRYYFKVTAYDSSGNESGFSNEVYKDTP
jgi:hypothetical protein